MNSKTKLIVYWMTTVAIAFVLLSGGAAELARQRDNVAGMTHLGYPLYVVTILGVWKVLGGVTLLAPRLGRLKEWAYAGTLIDLTGASVSHAACGDAMFHIVTPLVIAAIALTSWALRPSSRVVGSIVPLTA